MNKTETYIFKTSTEEEITHHVYGYVCDCTHISALSYVICCEIGLYLASKVFK